jgi:hypothetical protein
MFWKRSGQPSRACFAGHLEQSLTNYSSFRHGYQITTEQKVQFVLISINVEFQGYYKRRSKCPSSRFLHAASLCAIECWHFMLPISLLKQMAALFMACTDWWWLPSGLPLWTTFDLFHLHRKISNGFKSGDKLGEVSLFHSIFIIFIQKFHYLCAEMWMCPVML